MARYAVLRIAKVKTMGHVAGLGLLALHLVAAEVAVDRPF